MQKDFRIHENYTLQVIAEAFNLANHQNVTTINSGAYTLANTVGAGSTTNATLTPCYQLRHGVGNQQHLCLRTAAVPVRAAVAVLSS